MAMRERDFAAFILTHKRPDRVYTYDSLLKHGYTGPVYFVVDDQDPTLTEYVARFGDRVLVFSKEQIAQTFDEGDNFGDRRAIIYARNACFDLAEQVGARYFIQLDDDYTDFRYKTDERGQFVGVKYIRDLDAVFDIVLDYYKTIPAKSIAFGQGGDFVGGKSGPFAQAHMLRRKCMNTFICSTERRFTFFGRINEDVNVYTTLGRRGDLFLTMLSVAIQQKETQTNTGGMTELYLDSGTYVKSFYSVMYCPSSVRVTDMSTKNARLHHRVNWNATVPQIIPEEWRKPRTL